MSPSWGSGKREKKGSEFGRRAGVGSLHNAILQARTGARNRDFAKPEKAWLSKRIKVKKRNYGATVRSDSRVVNHLESLLVT